MAKAKKGQKFTTPFYGLTDKEMKSARKRKQEGVPKRKASTSMPKAGPVTITKLDGSIEVKPAHKGGSTNNIKKDND